MKIAKVVSKFGYDTCDKFEYVTKGRCEFCKCSVTMHAKGFDEICPRCGALLDWDAEFEIDPDDKAAQRAAREAADDAHWAQRKKEVEEMSRWEQDMRDRFGDDWRN